MTDEKEVGESESGGNKMNLSNLSSSKKSIRAGYLTSKGIKKGGNNPKRGGGNTKKGVKVTRGSDYLIPDIKKVFNHLQHAFTQALIF